MAGFQWILVGSGWDTSRMVRWGHLDPPKLPWGPPGRSEMPQKCHKTRIYGHKWLWWLQMAGSQWILVGTWLDTSRMACWCYLDPLKLPLGSPRVVRNGLFYGILELFLTPPGPPDGNYRGSKWHQQTLLDVSQPDLTYIH